MPDGGTISSFPVPSPDEWPADIVRLAARQEQSLGFVPNLLRAYVWKPDRLRAWYAHYRQLLDPSDALSLAEREMIAVVVSARNDCTYCASSHGAALRLLLDDEELADQIADDHRAAGLDERTGAILDYACKLTADPAACDGDDLARLRQHGLTDEAVWDVVELTAMFNFTNRLTMAASIEPNDGYHLVGRRA